MARSQKKNKPVADKPVTVSPIANIAIGYIQTFNEEDLTVMVKLSARIGNEQVTAQLEKITRAIKQKAPLSEVDVCALAFLILLAQNIEPDDIPPGD